MENLFFVKLTFFIDPAIKSSVGSVPHYKAFSGPGEYDADNSPYAVIEIFNYFACYYRKSLISIR